MLSERIAEAQSQVDALQDIYNMNQKGNEFIVSVIGEPHFVTEEDGFEVAGWLCKGGCKRDDDADEEKDDKTEAVALNIMTLPWRDGKPTGDGKPAYHNNVEFIANVYNFGNGNPVDYDNFAEKWNEWTEKLREEEEARLEAEQAAKVEAQTEAEGEEAATE